MMLENRKGVDWLIQHNDEHARFLHSEESS